MTPAPRPLTPKRSTRGTLRLEITSDTSHWTVQAMGEIDLSNADVLQQAIERAWIAAAEMVTIDLRGVDFIDLSGVRVIVSARDRLDGRLRLLKGPKPVQSVFRLTGAEAALPFEA